MSSNGELAIRVQGLSKCYEIYSKPGDRLKQFIYPKIKRLIGRSSNNYFNQFWALNNVSFEVRKGQTVGIIGRNGSGKSTLLQLICGTLTPTNGTVETSGRIAALLELGSGFNPEFTGRENVYLNAAVLGLTKTETDQRYSSIVEFADIGPFIDQPVKTYSSGMMVRLAFAVIAHVDADILIIDEALAVGDAFFTQKCMRYLRRFMESGSVLFVSHDTASVRNLCSDAVWLEKGCILEKGTSKDVSERYLEAFYEASTEETKTKKSKKLHIDSATVDKKDSRLDFINNTNIRNDIQLIKFDLNGPSFGDGGAQITSVSLLSLEGDNLAWIIGGEDVVLKVEAMAYENLLSPIVGFFIKDKLGQTLFGDNTHLTYFDAPVLCNANKRIEAIFQFKMPRLATGDYSITVAIADGTQEQHKQHHWVHDAVIFKSESTSVVSGLIGIPMVRIELVSI